MSGSGSYSSGSRTPSYSGASSSQYPPGTPDFDRYSRSSHSRSGADSPEYDQHSQTPSVANGRYAASESTRSTYSRVSSRHGNESPGHSSVGSSKRSHTGSLRRSSRLSENNGPPVGKTVSFDPDQVSLASEDEERMSKPFRGSHASRSPRQGTGTTSSTLRRTSDMVIEKFEQVRDSWNEFYEKWGTPVLAMFVLITALYFGRGTISNIIGRAGREVISEIQQAAKPQAFNLTGHLEPIWERYTKILDITEYEEWFDDVRDAEDAILAMWNGFPANDNRTANATQKNIVMKGYIDYRMAMRKRAEVNLENFLLARRLVVAQMFHLSNLWGRYIHTWLDSSSPSAMTLDAKEQERFSEYGFSYQQNQAGNTTAQILDRASERLLINMLRLHDNLLISRQPHHAAKKAGLLFNTTTNNPSTVEIDQWMQRSIALSDIKFARELEQKFIQDLIARSPYADLWDDGKSHSASLQALEEKLAALQLQLYEIRQMIVAVLGQVSIDPASEIPNQDGQVVYKAKHTWSQDINELLAACSKILKGVDESRARAEIRYAMLKTSTEQNERRKEVMSWRSENCGDATCFELAPEGAWGRFIGVAQQGLSLVGQGESKKPLAKRPSSAQDAGRKEGETMEPDNAGQHEKECCGEARENIWIDHLRFGAKELVFLDSYRRRGFPLARKS